MINESDEDDTGLLEELQRWIELAGSMEDPENCAVELILAVRAISKLVKLAHEADEHGQQLGMVSAIRTTTILRTLAAELAGREVTLEMPGVIAYRPEEVGRG
jgi:hypothetical protein